MRYLFLLATAVVVSASACAPRPMTDAERTSLADSVSQLATAMIRGLGHLDVDSLAARYDDSVAYGREGQVFGREALLAQMRATWRPGVSAALGTSDEVVRVLGRDAVVYSANVSGLMTDSGTGRSREILGALTFVLERRGGTWRVVAGHESVDPGAALPASASGPRPSHNR